MRLKSKGGFTGSQISLIRGSAITFALTWSRCSRDSKTMAHYSLDGRAGIDLVVVSLDSFAATWLG